MQAEPRSLPPKGFAETLATRRAWLGDAEFARQQALLRVGRAAAPERRRGDRRQAERREA